MTSSQDEPVIISIGFRQFLRFILNSSHNKYTSIGPKTEPISVYHVTGSPTHNINKHTILQQRIWKWKQTKTRTRVTILLAHPCNSQPQHEFQVWKIAKPKPLKSKKYCRNIEILKQSSKIVENSVTISLNPAKKYTAYGHQPLKWLWFITDKWLVKIVHEHSFLM